MARQLVSADNEIARKAPKGYWLPVSDRKAIELGSGHAYWLEALWLAFRMLGKL